MGRHAEPARSRLGRALRVVLPVTVLAAAGYGVAALWRHSGPPEPTATIVEDGSSADALTTSAANPSTSVPSVPGSATAATATSLRRGVTCTGSAAAAATATARRLQEAIAAAVSESAARISVAVHDWPSATTCSFRSSVTHDSASIVKVTTIATLLWQRGTEGRSLTTTERGWAKAAMVVSDNAAQSALWSRAGGAGGVGEFMRAAGMARSAPAGNGKWGLTQVTAADELSLLRVITHGDLLSAADRDYLLDLMRRVDPAQRWGVSAGAPPGSTVAIKNGWLDEETEWQINSIGYVSGGGSEHALVVLGDDQPSMEEGMEAVETVARAVHAALAA